MNSEAKVSSPLSAKVVVSADRVGSMNGFEGVSSQVLELDWICGN